MHTQYYHIKGYVIVNANYYYMKKNGSFTTKLPNDNELSNRMN